MKLLTLNTHSLEENDYKKKTEAFIKAIAKIQPQIIALQEVNQSCDAKPVSLNEIPGYYAYQKHIIIREDNHVLRVASKLKKMGICYEWTWIPIKYAYDKYDEGIAIMSLLPICNVNCLTVSCVDDYFNWKTRKILGIQTEETGDAWFYSVHYNWWTDVEEPFETQWNKTKQYLQNQKDVWLMGDFNNPAKVSGEGYDTVQKSGFTDSYQVAQKKDDGITVLGVIDGWRDKITDEKGIRIDQIWFMGNKKVKSSEVVFNGTNYPVVSDHYGVLIETSKE